MGNPVAWFEIYVQDMARAKAFYETVFQVQLQALGDPAGEMEMWSLPGDMNSYGAPGALVKRAGVPSGGSATLVYLHCEDARGGGPGGWRRGPGAPVQAPHRAVRVHRPGGGHRGEHDRAALHGLGQVQRDVEGVEIAQHVAFGNHEAVVGDHRHHLLGQPAMGAQRLGQA